MSVAIKSCLPCASRFSSKPYTFVVQGKPFYVHAACISACSAPLGRMMSGHMAEAQQGFALLEDVTQGTFTRFIRWTYSKDYESPAPKITTFSASEDGRLDRPVADDSILDDGIVVLEPTKKKVKKKKKDIYEVINLKETFMASTHDDLPSNPGKTPAARPNKSPEEGEEFTAFYALPSFFATEFLMYIGHNSSYALLSV